MVDKTKTLWSSLSGLSIFSSLRVVVVLSVVDFNVAIEVEVFVEVIVGITVEVVEAAEEVALVVDKASVVVSLWQT